MPKAEPSHVAQPVVFVALVYETLKSERFDSIADLAEAVKCRAAKLRIRYDATRITDAIAHVARLAKSPIVGSLPRVKSPDRLVSDPPIVSRDTAAQLLARLQAAPLRPMPKPTPGDRMDTQRLRVVLQAIEMLTTKGGSE